MLPLTCRELESSFAGKGDEIVQARERGFVKGASFNSSVEPDDWWSLGWQTGYLQQQAFKL